MNIIAPPGTKYWRSKSNPSLAGQVEEWNGIRWFVPFVGPEFCAIYTSERDGYSIENGRFWHRIDEHPELSDLEEVRA